MKQQVMLDASKPSGKKKPDKTRAKIFGVICEIRNLLKEIVSQNKEMLEIARNGKGVFDIPK